MNETLNKIGVPRTAVRFEFPALIVLVSFCAAAEGAAWRTDHRLARSADSFTPVRFIEIDPSLNFGSMDRPGGDAAEGMALIHDKEFDKALVVAARMMQSSPNNPAGYNLQGTAYLGKQDWTNARKSFERALKVNPGDAIALLNLAQIDIQQKDTAAARERFQAILAKDANNVPAMLGMAQLEILKGDSKAVLGWFEKARGARPEAVDPRLNIAAYYMRRGNFKQAISELTEATRVIPGNADLISLLGQAQLDDGQSKAAAETFRKLVAARPDAPLAYYRLATAQIAMNDTSGAAQSLTKALQIKTEFVDAAILLANLEARAKRYPEALKLAKQVQSVQPESPAGLLLEGDILVEQQRYADAAKTYEKALAKSQTGPIAVRLHAAQAKAGNAKEADATLQRWLKEHPDDVATLHYAALDNIRKGQNKLAMEQYQRVLQQDAKNLLALNNLASLYQREGDPRALQTAEAAYKINPESPVIADTLGWILVEQGKTARGLELLTAALARDPKNPDLRYRVAAARVKAGDKVTARKELEALLAGEKAFPQRDAAQALLKQL